MSDKRIQVMWNAVEDVDDDAVYDGRSFQAGAASRDAEVAELREKPERQIRRRRGTRNTGSAYARSRLDCSFVRSRLRHRRNRIGSHVAGGTVCVVGVRYDVGARKTSKRARDRPHVPSVSFGAATFGRVC